METRNTFDATADIGGAFLEHFGVEGMKWGVRKRKPTGKISRKETRKLIRDNKFDRDNAKPLTDFKPVHQRSKTSSDTRRKFASTDGSYPEAKFVSLPNRVDRDNRIGVSLIDKKRSAYTNDAEVYRVPKDPETAHLSNMDTHGDISLGKGLDRVLLNHAISVVPSGTKRLTVHHNTSDDEDSSSRLKEWGFKSNSDNTEHTLDLTRMSDSDGYLKEPKAGVYKRLGKSIADSTYEDYMNAVEKNRRATKHSVLDDDSNYLEHYGVKGMKWGRRKEEKPTAKLTENAPQKKPELGETGYDAQLPYKGIENRPKYGDIVKEYPDGSVDVFVGGGLGVLEEYLTPEEKLEADVLSLATQSMEKDFDETVKKIEKMEQMYETYSLMIKKLPLDDPKRKGLIETKNGLEERINASERKLKELSFSAEQPYTRLTNITDDAKSRREEALAKDPDLALKEDRASRRPDPGKLTYRSRPDNEKKYDTFKKNVNKDDRYKKAKEKSAEHSDFVKMETDSDVLIHHGVKGMKWGVRKRKPTSGKRSSSRKNTTRTKLSRLLDSEQRANRRLKKAQKKYRIAEAKQKASLYENATKNLNGKTSEASTKSEQYQPKSVHSLTDDELRAAINRLDMEKRYSALLAERQPKSRKAEVARVINKAASDAAGELVKTGVKTGATFIVKKTMTNKAKDD